MESRNIQMTAAPAPESGRPGPVPFRNTMAATGSLTAVFEAEEGPLLRFAFGLTGRREVAEDLVQEAFLRLHAHWAEVENARAWLFRCVRNLALNHLRDHSREVSEEAGWAATSAERPPDAAVGRMEAVGMVRMLVAELPESDRELVRLKYEEDLKYQEISRRTGMSVGNVGYRLHHALKGLADALRRAGIENAAEACD